MQLYRLKAAWLCSLLALPAAFLCAQSIQVKGHVSDREGETLPGVSILIEGSKNGTVTDVDGNYSIDVSSQDDVLVFSYIGYQPVRVRVGEQTSIHVTFDDNLELLEEVVVIGYASVKKKDLTGAISVLSEKDFQKGGASADRMMVGKLAGVQVTPNGGAPGSGSRIRIRGGASLTASNDPLIIIDGVSLANDGVAGSPGLLSTINPNDIETMTVMKDASATAIYGNRASNGVILITTRQAKYGQKLNIHFSTRASLSAPAKQLDVLSARQLTDIVQTHPKSSDEFRSLLGSSSTNWQDQLFQTAFGADNNLSVSGSSRAIPYRLSLGYLNEDGILKTGNMKRISTGLNLNPRFFDNRLKIDISLKGSNVRNRFAATNAIASALVFDPTQAVRAPGFDEYGGYFTWRLPGTNVLNTQAPVNPVLLLHTYDNTSKVWRGIGSAQIDYRLHFLPEWRASMNLAYDYAKGEGKVYVPEWAPQMLDRKGQNTDYGENRTNKLFEFYLNHTRTIPSLSGRLDLTAGYAYQDWKTHKDNFIDYTATGEVYRSPDFPYNEPRNTLLSVFARLNYAFNDRYLLSATVRRDGSSRFHPDHRWGTFPSLAFAWQLKEEDFLKHNEAVASLKWRIGYGQTGQQDVYDNYPYLARYAQSAHTNQYQFGDQFYVMFRPEAYDESLKWETTTTYNTAIDYGFWDNQVSGSIDFYVKKTSDLLNNIDVPAGSNFSNKLITNIGSMNNKGVEWTIRFTPAQTNDWYWDVRFNLSYNRNRISQLTLVDSPNYKGVATGWISGSTGGAVQLHSVGRNMYSFYLYKQVYDGEGRPMEGVYADLNGDGEVNTNDLYHIKSAEPSMTGGLSLSAGYKRWTLSASLRGNYGNYLYNNTASTFATYSTLFNQSKSLFNVPAGVLDSQFYNQRPLSDYYLENASFVKVDDISLRYDFGKIFRRQVSLQGVLSIQNVATFSKYTGFDPEISGGIDRDFYPRPRIGSVTFNFNF